MLRLAIACFSVGATLATGVSNIHTVLSFWETYKYCLVQTTLGCFPGSGEVSLASGQTQRLDELRQGDSVLVSGNTFEPVLGWLAVSHEQERGEKAKTEPN